jgi:hypothetical protein
MKKNHKWSFRLDKIVSIQQNNDENKLIIKMKLNIYIEIFLNMLVTAIKDISNNSPIL